MNIMIYILDVVVARRGRLENTYTATCINAYVKKLSSNYMHVDEKSNRITRPVVNIKLVLAGYQPK